MAQDPYQSIRSDGRQALAVAVAYFVADALLNKFALGDGWQIFWPLNGVTIALLITRPARAWPLLLAAVSLGTGIGEFMDDNGLASTLVQRALSVLEVCVSAALLPSFVDVDSWLAKPGLYPRFAAAVVTGPVVSGLLAATWFDAVDGTAFVTAFNSWALADAMGIAAVLPVTLAIRSTDFSTLLHGRRGVITLGTLSAAGVVTGIIFSTSQYPLIFVLYPLLMLVDWVLGLLGSSIALLCSCVIAVFLTEHGYGPFASPVALGMSRDLAVQLYLGFHLIGFLPISILFLQQRRMHRELRHSLALADRLASVDALTGVANRRTLDSCLQKQWEIAARSQTSLALLMVDADHFKEFNDRMGHQAGDACLRSLAVALQQRVTRPADVVARFGGEEFAVLLPGTSLEGACQVAERIRSAVQDLAIAHPGVPLVSNTEVAVPRCVTVSIGCAALIPTPNMTFNMLVELADQALYEAKGTGRDRVCAADPDTHIWAPGTATKKLRARLDAYRRDKR